MKPTLDNVKSYKDPHNLVNDFCQEIPLNGLRIRVISEHLIKIDPPFSDRRQNSVTARRVLYERINFEWAGKIS